MSTAGRSFKQFPDESDLKTSSQGRSLLARALNDRWRFRGRLVLAAAILIGIAGLSLTAYLSGDTSLAPAQNPAQPQTPEAGPQSAHPVDRGEGSIISQIFGSGPSFATDDQRLSWLFYILRVTLRLLLAALLATMLAIRPYKHPSVRGRDPYVAETQILLAVVASALMMIVADNAARAFGIFAAASLVRFRTNIRDPKETTVLLINLAIGLATGVGRWELAVILSVFVLATLWILESFESKQVVRSMQLKIRTHSVTDTDEVLKEIFSRHNLVAEVREFDREDDEDPLGRIVYHVTTGPRVSTDELSEEILSADPHNIDTVEWHQKKNVSYTYR